MLPRQRRPGGGTGGAHRMRMRPWQEPGHGSAASATTELDLQGVAAAGPDAAPASAGPRDRRNPAIVGRLRTPWPTGVIRPFSGRDGTGCFASRRYTGNTSPTTPGTGPPRLAPGRGQASREPVRAPPGPPATCDDVRAGASPRCAGPHALFSEPRPCGAQSGRCHHLPDRFAARGDWGGGLPQPAESSSAGRPTQDHRSACRTGRTRAHGRAHGHTSGARLPCPRAARTTIPAIRRSAP